jgi:hypothetical protein
MLAAVSHFTGSVFLGENMERRLDDGRCQLARASLDHDRRAAHGGGALVRLARGWLAASFTASLPVR